VDWRHSVASCPPPDAPGRDNSGRQARHHSPTNTGGRECSSCYWATSEEWHVVQICVPREEDAFTSCA
jgi:hypothetical protein